MQQAKGRAEELSASVLRRVEVIAVQIDDAIAAASVEVDPAKICDANDIALMSAVQSRYSYIGAIGRVAPGDNHVRCSTFGPGTNGYLLEPPDHVKGSRELHLGAKPTRDGHEYFAVLQGNVVVFVHSGVASLFLPTLLDMSLGARIKDGGPVVFFRGASAPNSQKETERGAFSLFFDGAGVRGVSASENTDYLAFVDIPSARVQASIYDAAAFFLPWGALLGLSLSILLFYSLRTFTSIPAALRRALQTDRVYMEYQPIVDLRSGQYVGAEALIRWKRGSTLVPPDRFIGVAERAGLMPLVTRRVVQLVARDTALFLRTHLDMHISINFSALDLTSGLALKLLTELLGVTGLPATCFWLEVTETSLADEGLDARISQIRTLGIRVAIDDFGTGYANLDVLACTKADLLKIDQRFVHAAVGHGQASEVSLAIFALAKKISFEMVGEGVETQLQAEILLKNGVQFAQGWLFGKPSSIAAFDKLIEKSKKSVRPKISRANLSLTNDRNGSDRAK
ncbi:EAL domain-containing protein [Variovorax sp. UMC13]|uniref:EAL domain-containing protein n=1 Tax=Variovorax sp. UMC13 TaxID=1862326 RepID=UPI001602E53A|nr:EAL domain-containing protein [Variovorax sp. UMC13]